MSNPNSFNPWADKLILWLEVLVGVAVVSAVIGKAYGGTPAVVFLLCGFALAFTVYCSTRMLSSLQDPSLEVAGRIHDGARESLEHEKLLLLQGIKELEADAATGKVDAEDYDHLRNKAEQRAIQIIEEIQESDHYWLNKAEALVGGAPAKAQRSKAKPAVAEAPSENNTTTAVVGVEPAAALIFDDRPTARGKSEQRVCAACQTPSAADANYCTGCGRPFHNREQEAA